MWTFLTEAERSPRFQKNNRSHAPVSIRMSKTLGVQTLCPEPSDGRRATNEELCLFISLGESEEGPLIKSRVLNWLVAALGAVLTLYGSASGLYVVGTEPSLRSILDYEGIATLVLAGLGIWCLMGGATNLGWARLEELSNPWPLVRALVKWLFMAIGLIGLAMLAAEGLGWTKGSLLAFVALLSLMILATCVVLLGTLALRE